MYLRFRFITLLWRKNSTQHKKSHWKRNEIEAKKDVSSESSENDFNMSGENASSERKTSLLEKKTKMIL